MCIRDRFMSAFHHDDCISDIQYNFSFKKNVNDIFAMDVLHNNPEINGQHIYEKIHNS